VSFIVLFMWRSLLRSTAASYRKERNGLSRRIALAEPVAHRLRATPAFVDRPHDQRLPAARITRSEDTGHAGCVRSGRDVAAGPAAIFDDDGAPQLLA